MSQPIDSRKPPQLTTSGGSSWTTPQYMAAPSNYHANNGIRSPTASYASPSPYPGIYPYTSTSQGHHFTYLPAQDHGHIQIPSMNPTVYNTNSYECIEPSRGEHHRSSSPYGRSSSHAIPKSSTPPPVSPISPEESTIKKKRKRADARQLKALNETYNRTAFPSTEERLALAKELDMTARSVQIWFQNKRQSMRQTNRQSSNVGASTQPFSMSGQDTIDDLEPSMAYGGPIADTSRSSHSQQRRVRHNDDSEHRKWF
ncbi:hypothetical protein H0H92_000610 [Tricholoma furcatifolium]|nr:hypothetical protein H0H92_000610 [Tricholoma furcatifolium]